MLKKLLCFSIILVIGFSLLNISYAVDILMDIQDPTATNINTISNATETIDNTIYTDSNTQDIENPVSDYEESAATTTTTDYDSEAELSISNIINIILISVGLVLILLGIAIIIKLK